MIAPNKQPPGTDHAPARKKNTLSKEFNEELTCSNLSRVRKVPPVCELRLFRPARYNTNPSVCCVAANPNRACSPPNSGLVNVHSSSKHTVDETGRPENRGKTQRTGGSLDGSRREPNGKQQHGARRHSTDGLSLTGSYHGTMASEEAQP